MLASAGLLAVLWNSPVAGIPGLAPRQAEKLAERLWQDESFVGSAEARRESGTVGRYFTSEDYRLLRGNPILGYWNARAFRWTGEGRIAWGGIEGIDPAARRIGKRAWDAAMKHVLERHGLRAETGAPVKLRGACVTATLDPPPGERGLAGVLLEVRFESPSGQLRYRIAVGKPTVEEAMLVGLDFLVSFALEQGGPHAGN